MQRGISSRRTGASLAREARVGDQRPRHPEGVGNAHGDQPFCVGGIDTREVAISGGPTRNGARDASIGFSADGGGGTIPTEPRYAASRRARSRRSRPRPRQRWRSRAGRGVGGEPNTERSPGTASRTARTTARAGTGTARPIRRRAGSVGVEELRHEVAVRRGDLDAVEPSFGRREAELPNPATISSISAPESARRRPEALARHRRRSERGRPGGPEICSRPLCRS